MCCLDKIDNIEQFKKVVIEDVCFYKSVVLENYYNIYKNLKVDVYKDIPDEEMDNFDNILPSFNGYYYIKYENIPTNIKDNYFNFENVPENCEDCRFMYRPEILIYSPDKENIEQYILNNKFNL